MLSSTGNQYGLKQVEVNASQLTRDTLVVLRSGDLISFVEQQKEAEDSDPKRTPQSNQILD